MKKNLFAIVLILAGALSISPLTFALEGQQAKEELPDVMYATNREAAEKNIDKSEVEKDNSKLDYDSGIAKDTDSSVNTVKNSTDNNAIVSQSNNKNTNKNTSSTNRDVKANNSYVANKPSQKSDVNSSIEANKPNTDVDYKNRKALSKEEALDLLNKENNNNQEYGYMGDENTFNVLKEKGHEGYVFVPDVSTDLGLFVDKNTSEVYVFHPSGSLDLY